MGGGFGPRLLPGLSAPCSWAIEAISGGVATASPYWRGRRVRVVPVDGWRQLGWSRGSVAATIRQALRMLLEGDVKKVVLSPEASRWSLSRSGVSEMSPRWQAVTAML